MKLTPLDIQQHQFRSVLFGLDPKEVDAFLDLVGGAFEDLIRQHHDAVDEVRRLRASLEEFRDREKTLKETMITATKIAEDVKQGAQREAEAVISQAEVQAEKLVQNAHTRLVRILDDINELKRQKAQFEGSLRSLIDTHGKLLEAMSDRIDNEAAELSAVSRRVEPVAGEAKRSSVSEDQSAGQGSGR